ncbi:unnamed protein product, partial [Amoebophrya sp. A120]|eukprot:GSA120T00010167001.1
MAGRMEIASAAKTVGELRSAFASATAKAGLAVSAQDVFLKKDTTASTSSDSIYDWIFPVSFPNTETDFYSFSYNFLTASDSENIDTTSPIAVFLKEQLGGGIAVKIFQESVKQTAYVQVKAGLAGASFTGNRMMLRFAAAGVAEGEQSSIGKIAGEDSYYGIDVPSCKALSDATANARTVFVPAVRSAKSFENVLVASSSGSSSTPAIQIGSVLNKFTSPTHNFAGVLAKLQQNYAKSGTLSAQLSGSLNLGGTSNSVVSLEPGLVTSGVGEEDFLTAASLKHSQFLYIEFLFKLEEDTENTYASHTDAECAAKLSTAIENCFKEAKFFGSLFAKGQNIAEASPQIFKIAATKKPMEQEKVFIVHLILKNAKPNSVATILNEFRKEAVFNPADNSTLTVLERSLKDENFLSAQELTAGAFQPVASTGSYSRTAVVSNAIHGSLTITHKVRETGCLEDAVSQFLTKAMDSGFAEPIPFVAVECDKTVASDTTAVSTVCGFAIPTKKTSFQYQQYFTSNGETSRKNYFGNLLSALIASPTGIVYKNYNGNVAADGTNVPTSDEKVSTFSSLGADVKHLVFAESPEYSLTKLVTTMPGDDNVEKKSKLTAVLASSLSKTLPAAVKQFVSLSTSDANALLTKHNSIVGPLTGTVADSVSFVFPIPLIHYPSSNTNAVKTVSIFNAFEDSDNCENQWKTEMKKIVALENSNSVKVEATSTYDSAKYSATGQDKLIGPAEASASSATTSLQTTFITFQGTFTAIDFFQGEIAAAKKELEKDSFVEGILQSAVFEVLTSPSNGSGLQYVSNQVKDSLNPPFTAHFKKLENVGVVLQPDVPTVDADPSTYPYPTTKDANRGRSFTVYIRVDGPLFSKGERESTFTRLAQSLTSHSSGHTFASLVKAEVNANSILQIDTVALDKTSLSFANHGEATIQIEFAGATPADSATNLKAAIEPYTTGQDFRKKFAEAVSLVCGSHVHPGMVRFQPAYDPSSADFWWDQSTLSASFSAAVVITDIGSDTGKAIQQIFDPKHSYDEGTGSAKAVSEVTPHAIKLFINTLNSMITATLNANPPKQPKYDWFRVEATMLSESSGTKSVKITGKAATTVYGRVVIAPASSLANSGAKVSSAVQKRSKAVFAAQTDAGAGALTVKDEDGNFMSLLPVKDVFSCTKKNSNGYDNVDQYTATCGLSSSDRSLAFTEYFGTSSADGLAAFLETQSLSSVDPATGTWDSLANTLSGVSLTQFLTVQSGASLVTNRVAQSKASFNKIENNQLALYFIEFELLFEGITSYPLSSADESELITFGVLPAIRKGVTDSLKYYHVQKPRTGTEGNQFAFSEQSSSDSAQITELMNTVDLRIPAATCFPDPKNEQKSVIQVAVLGHETVERVLSFLSYEQSAGKNTNCVTGADVADLKFSKELLDALQTTNSGSLRSGSPFKSVANSGELTKICRTNRAQPMPQTRLVGKVDVSTLATKSQLSDEIDLPTVTTATQDAVSGFSRADSVNLERLNVKSNKQKGQFVFASSAAISDTFNLNSWFLTQASMSAFLKPALLKKIRCLDSSSHNVACNTLTNANADTIATTAIAQADGVREYLQIDLDISVGEKCSSTDGTYCSEKDGRYYQKPRSESELKNVLKSTVLTVVQQNSENGKYKTPSVFYELLATDLYSAEAVVTTSTTTPTPGVSKAEYDFATNVGSASQIAFASKSGTGGPNLVCHGPIGAEATGRWRDVTANGKTFKSLKFLKTGTIEYCTASASTLPGGAASRTIMGWVKPESSRNGPFGYGKGQCLKAFKIFVSDNLVWNLDIYCDAMKFYDFNDGDKNLNEWYHMALMWDESKEKHRVYVNGVLVKEGTTDNSNTPNTEASSGKICLGGRVDLCFGASHDERYQGEIAGFAVYAGAISLPEVVQHMARTGPQGPLSAAQVAMLPAGSSSSSGAAPVNVDFNGVVSIFVPMPELAGLPMYNKLSTKLEKVKADIETGILRHGVPLTKTITVKQIKLTSATESIDKEPAVSGFTFLEQGFVLEDLQPPASHFTAANPLFDEKLVEMLQKSFYETLIEAVSNGGITVNNEKIPIGFIGGSTENQALELTKIAVVIPPGDVKSRRVRVTIHKSGFTALELQNLQDLLYVFGDFHVGKCDRSKSFGLESFVSAWTVKFRAKINDVASSATSSANSIKFDMNPLEAVDLSPDLTRPSAYLLPQKLTFWSLTTTSNFRFTVTTPSGDIGSVTRVATKAGIIAIMQKALAMSFFRKTGGVLRFAPSHIAIEQVGEVASDISSGRAGDIDTYSIAAGKIKIGIPMAADPALSLQWESNEFTNLMKSELEKALKQVSAAVASSTFLWLGLEDLTTLTSGISKWSKTEYLSVDLQLNNVGNHEKAPYTDFVVPLTKVAYSRAVAAKFPAAVGKLPGVSETGQGSLQAISGMFFQENCTSLDEIQSTCVSQTTTDKKQLLANHTGLLVTQILPELDSDAGMGALASSGTLASIRDYLKPAANAGNTKDQVSVVAATDFTTDLKQQLADLQFPEKLYTNASEYNANAFKLQQSGTGSYSQPAKTDLSLSTLSKKLPVVFAQVRGRVALTRHKGGQEPLVAIAAEEADIVKQLESQMESFLLSNDGGAIRRVNVLQSGVDFYKQNASSTVPASTDKIAQIMDYSGTTTGDSYSSKRSASFNDESTTNVKHDGTYHDYYAHKEFIAASVYNRSSNASHVLYDTTVVVQLRNQEASKVAHILHDMENFYPTYVSAEMFSGPTCIDYATSLGQGADEMKSAGWTIRPENELIGPKTDLNFQGKYVFEPKEDPTFSGSGMPVSQSYVYVNPPDGHEGKAHGDVPQRCYRKVMMGNILNVKYLATGYRNADGTQKTADTILGQSEAKSGEGIVWEATLYGTGVIEIQFGNCQDYMNPNHNNKPPPAMCNCVQIANQGDMNKEWCQTNELKSNGYCKQDCPCACTYHTHTGPPNDCEGSEVRVFMDGELKGTAWPMMFKTVKIPFNHGSLLKIEGLNGYYHNQQINHRSAPSPMMTVYDIKYESCLPYKPSKYSLTVTNHENDNYQKQSYFGASLLSAIGAEMVLPIKPKDSSQFVITTSSTDSNGVVTETQTADVEKFLKEALLQEQTLAY